MAGRASPIPPPLAVSGPVPPAISFGPPPVPAISFGPPPTSPTTAATDVVGRDALDTYSGLPIGPNPARGAGAPESSKVTVKDVIRYVEAPVFGRTITLRLEIPAGSAVHTEEDVREGQTRALLTACVSDNADVANSARAELGSLYEFLVLDALERHPDFRRAAEEATHHLTKEQKLGYLLAHTLLLPDGTILLKKPSRPPTPAAPEGVPAGEVIVPEAGPEARIGDWGRPGGRPANMDLPPNHILTVCRERWKALPKHLLAKEALDAPDALLQAWRKYMQTTAVDHRLLGLGLGERGDESITGIFNKIFRGLGPAPATLGFVNPTPRPDDMDEADLSGANVGFAPLAPTGPSASLAVYRPPSPSSSSGSNT